MASTMPASASAAFPWTCCRNIMAVLTKEYDRPVFALRNVCKSSPGADHFRLHIAGFNVRAGDALALVGESGCGKSTALDLLACALRPDAPGPDSFFLFSPCAGKKTDVFSAWERGGSNATAEDRMCYMGYVLQTGGLLPFLTCADNITLACKVLNTVHTHIRAIRDIIEQLGIAPLLAKYPSQLSVGQRQRVAIARAMAHGPSVILADEPTAALDPANSRLVMQLLLSLARKQGSTVIMVSHEQALARETGFTLVPIRTRQTANGVVSTLCF